MRGVWAIGIYGIWVFAGAGLLAPLVWWVAHAAAAGTGLAAWVDHPFSRYVHRCLLGVAILGLWPLTGALECRGWREIGLGRIAGRWGRVGVGLGMAGVGCVLLILAESLTGTRVWKEEVGVGTILAGVVLAAISGFAVALIEEVVFRGVLWKGVHLSLGGVAAVLISSLIYGLSHYLGRPVLEGEVGWSSGFEVLIRMLAGEGAKTGWVPGMLTLFLLGVVFSMSFWREGTLYFAMGLHGGIVFWIKLRAVLTRTREGVTVSGDPLSGWAALVLAVAAVWVYAKWISREERKSDVVLRKEPWIDH